MDVQEWIAGTGSVDSELYKQKTEFAQRLLIFLEVTYDAYTLANYCSTCMFEYYGVPENGWYLLALVNTA